jgi:hypothetical protein
MVELDLDGLNDGFSIDDEATSIYTSIDRLSMKSMLGETYIYCGDAHGECRRSSPGLVFTQMMISIIRFHSSIDRFALKNLKLSHSNNLEVIY